MNVLSIGTDSCQRCEDYTVLNIKVTDFDRLEELGGRLGHLESDRRSRVKRLGFL